MDNPAALHRIRVGVPATVEHSSEAGPETGKWIAETTQVGFHRFLSYFLIRRSEFYYLHGCVEASATCQGPASSDLARACDRVC